MLLTSSGARIGGTEPGERNVFAGNDVGLAIVGGDLTGVYGNWFGQRRDGAVVGNDRGVLIAGVALPNGTVVDQALDNVVGDGSAATDDEFAFCAAACNVIAGSSIAGVDLAGTPAQGQAASGDSTISGNWIGLNVGGGEAGNTTGVLVGDAGVSAGVMIGGVSAGEGNLISGNDVGIDQSGGQGVLNVFRNIFGADPDQDDGDAEQPIPTPSSPVTSQATRCWSSPTTSARRRPVLCSPVRRPVSAATSSRRSTAPTAMLP